MKEIPVQCILKASLDIFFSNEIVLVLTKVAESSLPSEKIPSATPAIPATPACPT